ncbi:rhamnogalacturonan acetylesterase [Sediminibacillus halophilus]|uniref:Lysophospholipase L1 n=1 Tax=Sediminibacillus halophilus TaxID=482461 RepID=A0A1G9N804_9BACI|nr:rhamnogalacturonan acetylesterase [Sediminibacillus halophilus]SDL82659.1 Lysophospholipase L1 [Sediminibacillus halophilus]
MGIRIFLAGDSTVSDYGKHRAPQAGWGQALPRFFETGVVVFNRAAGGKSSKSFITEGRLDEINRDLQPGDYLFIQFGHNDSKPETERHTDPFTTYQNCLKQYVTVARQNQAFPVLLTPVQRRYFSENGSLQETHGDYPAAMRELAHMESVPLIDLTKKTTVLLEKSGDIASRKLFMWFEPGEEENYPNGVQDNTHFNEQGAEEIAGLVCRCLKTMKLPLADYLILPMK